MPVQRVAIVIQPGVQALDVAGPVDVFAEANSFLPPGERYETLLLAADTTPLRASNAMLLAADRSIAECGEGFDILLVAGGPAMVEAEPDAELTAWLQEAPRRATLYGAICTGAFCLGHAGLLHRRRCTTHWQNAARLAARFPTAQVEPERLHVRDGALITSAGVAAGIDLSLALVSQRHGPVVAAAVAKRLVLAGQPRGMEIVHPLSFADFPPPIGRIAEHVSTHLTERHSLDSLAQIAGMSGRNLARHFVREMGLTPHEFVEEARLRAARRLLAESDLPLKAIAFDCGFPTAERMRAVFLRKLGILPACYRSNFQRR